MSEPALRVVRCEECERLRTALEAAKLDLEQAQTDARIARRQLAAARAAEREQRRDDPKYEVAERLFDYWREQCGHPRAQLGPKREQALLARLEKYTPREIAMAIRGAALAAYVDESGVRHDDLELICRNEVKLEKFIDRYERWKESRA
jgi:hypothetical protein